MEFLGRLVHMPGIEWPAVELFHLDEYIGLPITHPASFRKYLLERLIRAVRPGSVSPARRRTRIPRRSVESPGTRCVASP